MVSNQLPVFLFVLTIGVTFVNPCSVTYEWKPLTLEETVSGVDIVVFGQEVEYVKNRDRWYWSTDAVFHVYCVLKTDDGPAIPEKVIIESVRPVHSCMGTFTRVGEVMLLTLRRTQSGNFRWHELGVMQTAKFAPTMSNLETVMRVVGVDVMAIPEGRSPLAQPSCPLPHEEESKGKGEESAEELPEEKQEEEQEAKPARKQNNKNNKGKKGHKDEQDTTEDKKGQKNADKWPQDEEVVQKWGTKEESGSGEFFVQL